MATNDKGRAPGKDATPKTTTNTPKHTEPDPVLGWFNLAKESRMRQQKRGWNKGGRK